MNATAELTGAQRAVLLNPNQMPTLWPQLEPLIKKACDWSQGQFTPEAVVDGVLSGAYALLAFMDCEEVCSIGVLTISQLPSGMRILEVLLASGEGLRDWRRFEAEVGAYGKQFGCTKFRMIGREGLQKMLPDWKRTAVVLEREIV